MRVLDINVEGSRLRTGIGTGARCSRSGFRLPRSATWTPIPPQRRAPAQEAPRLISRFPRPSMPRSGGGRTRSTAPRSGTAPALRQAGAMHGTGALLLSRIESDRPVPGGHRASGRDGPDPAAAIPHRAAQSPGTGPASANFGKGGSRAFEELARPESSRAASTSRPPATRSARPPSSRSRWSAVFRPDAGQCPAARAAVRRSRARR